MGREGENFWPRAADTFKRYLQRAIEGDAFSQYRLGMRYSTGEGVAKDEQLAREWLGKAAMQGQTDAQEALRKLAPNAPHQAG